MIKAGTTGSKGNTQIVIPFVTKSYGSTRDPPEKTIPMCTLHNFPNLINHTIQWARDCFEGIFTKEIDNIKSYKEQGDNFLESLKKESIGILLSNLQSLEENLIKSRTETYSDCVRWARTKYEKFFVETIQKLIKSFPEDHMTEEGIPFWHPPKRFPHIVEFNKDNQECIDFIKSTAMLRAYNFGIKKDISDEEIIKIASEYKPIIRKEDEIEDQEKECERIRKEISQIKIGEINVVNFEKDDDDNGHILFIKSCSNLRAENYCIEPADFFKTKFIAGKIIPAMITTTAVVSGLQCVEFIKVIQKMSIDRYYSSFLNLGIAYIDGAEPEAVESVPFANGIKFSIWDRIILRGDPTLQEIFDYISSKYKCDVDMVTCGQTTLYMMFSSAEVKSRRIKMHLREIYKEVMKKDFEFEEMNLTVAVSLQDGTELPDDAPFPEITVIF